MVDEERDEGIDVDALDKTLEKLTKVVERLTIGLEGFTKQAEKSTQSSRVDHDKIHKQNMERQAEYFANVKAMKLLSAEINNGGNSFKMFTGLLTKGASAGYVFEKLTKHTNDYIDTSDKLRDAQEELNKMIERFGEIGSDKGGTEGKWSDASPEDRKKGAKLKEDTKGKETSGLADKLSGAKEFFGKHKMGMMVGAGSAGVLIGILKKAFDSSPMFQQIYKLLNFGIMMILRPIGDFFGFLMRPIMIMLLRKFIIPWYTKMYPQMMKWGTEIGSKLAAALSALASGDIGGAFAALWGEVDWGEIIWNAVRLMSPAIAAADFIAGLFGTGDNTYTNEWGRNVSKWFNKGLEEAKPEWNKFWTDTYAWFSNGITSITASFNTIFYQILGWIGYGLTTVTKDWNDMWTNVYNWLDDGLAGIGKSWNSMWDLVYNWISNGISSLNPFSGLGGDGNGNSDNSWNPFTWANGGHITEPIMGIGKSGQQYMMGESGNETVIPDNKLGSMGGSNITINIQNMSGSQQDLNNLRQTILDVMQQSNTRRGRV